MRCICLVLNKCTKYCQNKKRQKDRNEIGAMHFFRWNLLGLINIRLNCTGSSEINK